MDEVDRLLAGHPKDAKLALATTIITEYHDAASAEQAAARWQREIAEGATPQDIPIVQLSRRDLRDGRLPAAQLLKLANLCPSTGDARRTIAQGGAYLGEDKTPIAAHDQPIDVTDGLLLWVGKKRFCRVQLVD
jgi:tyrosyl-tRNA synthetase